MRAVRIAATALVFAAPAAAYAQTDPVAECDRLAASPYDTQARAPGVTFDAMDGNAAVAACRNALKQQPGDPVLQFQLARAYDALAEFDLAISNYERAGQAGHAAAWTAIGSLYEYGYGVPQDDALAGDYYQRGVDLGDIVGTGNLAYLYHQGTGRPQDYAEALRLYLIAAEAGDAWAQNKAGFFYENGYSVPVDLKSAFKWYFRSAQAGDFWGQYNTGVMYERGQGVEQSDVEAARWYRAAADQGNGLAYYNLAWLTEAGRGVRADPAAAEELFRQASMSDDGEARALAGNALAWRFAQQNRNLDEAEELIRAALEEPAVSEADRTTFHDTLGWVLHRQGRDAEAIAPLKEAIRLAPDIAAFHAHLGDVYEATGRLDRARVEWQAAIDLDLTNGTDPDWNRAEIEQKLRQAAS